MRRHSQSGGGSDTAGDARAFSGDVAARDNYPTRRPFIHPSNAKASISRRHRIDALVARCSPERGNHDLLVPARAFSISCCGGSVTTVDDGVVVVRGIAKTVPRKPSSGTLTLVTLEHILTKDGRTGGLQER